MYGDYPPEMREMVGLRLPTFSEEERSKILTNKLDFIGINHYNAMYTMDCMFSPCNSTYDFGESMVYTTGEKNGTYIGDSVILFLRYSDLRIFSNICLMMFHVTDMFNDVLDCNSILLCCSERDGKSCDIYKRSIQ